MQRPSSRVLNAVEFALHAVSVQLNCYKARRLPLENRIGVANERAITF